MEEKEQVLNVVNRIIGPLSPVGETDYDEVVKASMEIAVHVCEGLLKRIIDVARENEHRSEYSMKEVAAVANDFISQYIDEGKV